MKCNIHNEIYIWISEIDNSYYCNQDINELIENDMYLTSDNYDRLYNYFINLLELENFKGA
ncbi:hypothetical protein [Spiroplasma endosymbiont of Polydrusus pterygomalis]|uniref:hypothetical protein n=1 Tax=Spiroplasma endosymbiont of Polydrusus pterygomalis TaxID=3139327 RepID=UPI003CCA81C6